ncbi:hypothetical protein QVD17_30893 [Tagetes erecta]|uniref:Uncharacterized protein n=1 Tax=Tagetes erecta TaxID=13708 RepID=A0AAD8K6G7_TARER|nr:hypothetical protein QVD17_30893 [Tagetes erecta]
MLSSKSSNWLHRLRASRGFPDSDHIDLDHFLSSSPHQIHPPKTPPLPHHHKSNDNGSISDLLSDLFHMGADFQPKSRTKKASRKQHCSKICHLSTNSDARVSPSPLPSPLPLPLAASSNHVVEEEDAKALSAYSQTEVTVIDTSVPCWKFEKVLYRSKNVWKLGEKKGKALITTDRNKRLMNDNLHKNKFKKKFKLCTNSSKFNNQGHDQGKMVVANEKKRDHCSQVREKSFGKKQKEEDSTPLFKVLSKVGK